MRDVQDNNRRYTLLLGGLGCVLLLLFATNIFFGSVDIPADQVVNALTGRAVEKQSWAYIITESRLPQTITATLCGASLAVSGLILQTLFHNPLAGPSILGITNGASLGVSLVMLLGGGVIGVGAITGGGDFHLGGFIAIVVGAFAGAMIIIALILAMSSFIRGTLMLLIVGIMVGYLTSSVVSLLYLFANADNVHNFAMWGMGSFSDVSTEQLPWFSAVCIVSLTIAVILVKPLNILQLGDSYAVSLGIHIRNTRRQLLLATGLLTATATAFCGPVAFIGLATPHIARLVVRTSNQQVLLPATILLGSIVALLCNIICVLPPNMIIPVNAVTPIFGAPVILYIICRKK